LAEALPSPRISPDVVRQILSERKTRETPDNAPCQGESFSVRKACSPLVRDPLNFESLEQMHRESIGQSLNQFVPPCRHELLRGRANARVVNGARDLIVELTRLARWPKCDVECEPLRRRPFFIGNPDMRTDFQLLDVDSVSGALLPDHFLACAFSAAINVSATYLRSSLTGRPWTLST
jgi:hypothetical protein